MLKRILLYAIYVIIIVALLIAIIAAFRSDKSTSKKVAQSGKAQVHQATNKTGGAIDITKSYNPKPQTQPKAPVAVPAKPSQATTPISTASPNASAPSQLNNTGPGSVVALFIGSVVAGSLGFSVYQRKKLASTV